MSGFNFGQAGNTGFSFGSPKPAAAPAPATGGFGMVGTTQAAPNSGFSFGTPNPAQPAAPQQAASQSLFGMPMPQANAAQGGGFSFGSPAPGGTPGGGGGGFSFG